MDRPWVILVVIEYRWICRAFARWSEREVWILVLEAGGIEAYMRNNRHLLAFAFVAAPLMTIPVIMALDVDNRSDFLTTAPWRWVHR